MKLNNDRDGFESFLFSCLGKNLSIETDFESNRTIYYFIFDYKTANKVKSLLLNEFGIDIQIIIVDVKNFDYDVDDLCYFILQEQNGIKSIWSDIFKVIRTSRISVCLYVDTRGKIELRHWYAVDNDESTANHGWRDDLQTVFMSSWEANIARILNYINIGWEYEMYKVELKTYHSNVEQHSYSYTPDFTLSDGSVIEVKGFWDSNSVEVASCFSREYPNIKKYYIDGDMYGTLKTIYSGTIENWEHSRDKGYPSNNIPLIGITIPDRKVYVKLLTELEQVYFERDQDNPYDRNAIKVVNSNGNHLGFVAKDWAAIYAMKLDLGMQYDVRVKSIQEKVITLKVTRNNHEALMYEIFKPTI
ncbi:HIRAN domain-containing protein [Paenibacillus macquariensis]|uniref:Phage endonuclease I n=1 Tax=Paenibacillus macquariensis TaxID=948756 RepID=A0ABY1JKC1_9BACL|nr:HIRAN domain-containing protein [Paenibacillus macquariensis]MEC0089900.1 HIRAN domain-containing protein [Paenibacillus macquariensis]OAB30640.1 hypothetical protein PMSM_21045 [Paenibacillus macquariensis subsp. macquariensis]SIQ33904.1 Phage endonuclease I [Paenibacillus macquariensis]